MCKYIIYTHKGILLGENNTMDNEDVTARAREEMSIGEDHDDGHTAGVRR